MVKEEGVPTEGGGVSGDGEALAEEEIAAEKGALGRGQVVGTEACPHGYEEDALVAKGWGIGRWGGISGGGGDTGWRGRWRRSKGDFGGGGSKVVWRKVVRTSPNRRRQWQRMRRTTKGEGIPHKGRRWGRKWR